MRFCPRCGGLMLPVRKEGNRVILRCNRCGYEEEARERIMISRTIEHSPHEKTIVVDESAQNLKVLPTVRALCPRCGNNLAYYWMVQTRAADEPATRFFKCTKCGYVWREYD